MSVPLIYLKQNPSKKKGGEGRKRKKNKRKEKRKNRKGKKKTKTGKKERKKEKKSVFPTKQQVSVLLGSPLHRVPRSSRAEAPMPIK